MRLSLFLCCHEPVVDGFFAGRGRLLHRNVRGEAIAGNGIPGGTGAAVRSVMAEPACSYDGCRDVAGDGFTWPPYLAAEKRLSNEFPDTIG
jgi:hypothetical protein